MNKTALTQKRLKELLHYNKETGEFTRLVSCMGYKPGTVVGSKNVDGYLGVNIDGKQYFTHRLAFLYVEGYFPEYSVDHKNGTRDDNTWNNLRHVTQACNCQNSKENKNNTSGFNGVYFHKENNKYMAGVSPKGRFLNLGSFHCPLDAALARLTWEVQCDEWNCDNTGKLVNAIKKAWPEFNNMCLK